MYIYLFVYLFQPMHLTVGLQGHCNACILVDESLACPKRENEPCIATLYSLHRHQCKAASITVTLSLRV